MNGDAGSAAALWARARDLHEAGVRKGAIHAYRQRVTTIAAGGIVWVLRVLENAAEPAPRGADPFLPPYDPDQHVADLGRHHVLLLNKYPVLPAHVLIVTREALSQDAIPGPGDFAAATRLLDGPHTLLFYNGGPESGASQPHRHFQAVRLPLGPSSEAIPTAPWIRDHLAGAALPFPGAALAIAAGAWSEEDGGAQLRTIAVELLRRCGRSAQAPGSFNLLLTREWMLAVPRVARAWGGVPINSLAYAGALIARSQAAERTLRRNGPLAVLIGAADGR
ncbi:MAG TPA: DUF4922 domain-containing protein [Gammaproteobacteria bacterium]|nr:DUF4922 domain-containing protein [Gammaproteobacteria bacterium]